MSKVFLSLVICCACILIKPGYASSDGLQGIVIGRTHSTLASQFFQDFTSYWRQQRISTITNIRIEDKASGRGNATLTIYYKYEAIFQTSLSTKNPLSLDDIRSIVESVAQQVQEKKFANVTDPDLGIREI